MMGNKGKVNIPDSKNDAFKDLTNAIQEQRKELEEKFKSIPTPIDFAKLQKDVAHHDKIIYGILITVVISLIGFFIALFGSYSVFDNKIAEYNNSTSPRFDDLNTEYKQLRNKIDEEIKATNLRIDTLMIRREENKPLEKK